MKRVIIIFAFLLFGCSHDLPQETVSPLPLTDFFEFSEICPSICFMGISPGKTALEEVAPLLQASDQFSVPTSRKDKYDIWTKWFLVPSTPISSWVNILINPQDNLVQSIRFISIDPYRVKDFIGLLGEPDEISVSFEEPADARYIRYTLFYPKMNVMVFINTTGFTGPKAEDKVKELYVNVPVDEEHVQSWIINDYNNRQPWLGYGHIEEYLPGRKLPSP